jgi:beta-amylase
MLSALARPRPAPAPCRRGGLRLSATVRAVSAGGQKGAGVGDVRSAPLGRASTFVAVARNALTPNTTPPSTLPQGPADAPPSPWSALSGGFAKSDEELRSLALPPRGRPTGDGRGRGPAAADGNHPSTSGRERHAAAGTASDDDDRPSTSGRGHHPAAVPVFVMLPLDTVWLDPATRTPVLTRGRALDAALAALASAGVAGVMVDVWWGVVEAKGPGAYEWGAYAALFEKCAAHGLAVQAVTSFHAAGGNVGDTCTVPLPAWVLEAGEAHPDLFYADGAGVRSRECLSLGADDLPLLPGPLRWGGGGGNGQTHAFWRRRAPARTPLEAYAAFIAAFTSRFRGVLGSVVTELTIGLGPAGELRYPSYPEGDGRWRFPGIGQFQCHDAHMLAALRRAAAAAGEPGWGAPPDDAGAYTDPPWHSPFFADGPGGGWDSPYGRFFLGFYSGALIDHGSRVLAAARDAAGKAVPIAPANLASPSPSSSSSRPALHLGAKLAGVHWWFRTRAHAAELTAGYYNTRHRCGYTPIFEAFAALGVRASFTCVEMRDAEHPPECEASPEGLLNQVLGAAAGAGVPVTGENALLRFDPAALDRISHSALGRSAAAGRLAQLTFLRMGDCMFDEAGGNWPAFCGLLARLREGPED